MHLRGMLLNSAQGLLYNIFTEVKWTSNWTDSGNVIWRLNHLLFPEFDIFLFLKAECVCVCVY